MEYIHSRGYAHADVKGSNILLQGNGKEKLAYLVDYGLAYRFRTSSGEHKVFVQDARRAHEGTLEFTSRDAHHGSTLIILPLSYRIYAFRKIIYFQHIREEEI